MFSTKAFYFTGSFFMAALDALILASQATIISGVHPGLAHFLAAKAFL